MAKKKKFVGLFDSVVVGFHTSSKVEDLAQLSCGEVAVQGADYMASFNPKEKKAIVEKIEEKSCLVRINL